MKPTTYKQNSLTGQVYKKRKTKRNEPCPCGSKKKFKNCCLNR